MPLPTARTTTYAADAPIKSADLNALQDAVVGDLHGNTIKHKAIRPVFISAGWATATDGGNLVLASSGAGDAYVDLELEVGESLLSVTVALLGDGVADLDIDVERHYKDGTAKTSIQKTDHDNQAAAYGDVTNTLPAAAKVDATSYIAVRFNASATGLKIKNLRYTTYKDATA